MLDQLYALDRDRPAGPAVAEWVVTEEVKAGPRRVAVVGGGAAGLAAAWRLVSAGHDVELLERREEVGGRMRTERLDETGFDAAVQLVASNYTELFGLARAAGVADMLVKAPGRDAVWRKGRAHPLTYGSVTSMIASSALPTSLKLKLGAKYLPFLGRRTRLDLHNLVGTGGLELDSGSIGAWGERELGTDFVELLAYPLLGAYYGSAPEDTSAAVYHALARVGMNVSVYASRGGMGALAHGIAKALAERRVNVSRGTAIERVVATSRGVVLHSTSGSEQYDGVVIAVPAAEAARLIARDPVAEWLALVRTAPTCTLGLALSQPAPADYFGLSLPRNELHGAAVAVCVQERKPCDLVPAGRGALLVMPAPEQASVLARLEPGEVLDRLLPAVERVLPGVQQTVERARVTYFPEGNPVFYPGYIGHLSRFRSELLPARMTLAGDYLVAPTVEGAVRSGLAAARWLLGNFRA